MTPAMLRVLVALFDFGAAQLRLKASMMEATEKVEALATSMQVGYDEVIRSHPDLMYTDVMLDGFYGEDEDSDGR